MTQKTTNVEMPIATHEWFYVGGAYEKRAGESFLTGQMYVEKFVPVDKTKVTPVVMFHGGAQSGTNFISSPDGRRGWIGDFLSAGYSVYVVDQPERGRSGHQLNGATTEPMQRYSAERIQSIFTAPAKAARYPRATRHSKWPGSGEMGDATFDQFFASQVEMLDDRTEIERVNRDAGVTLLDKIGDAILITHSQSGPFGWLIADARPNLVKGIVAVEPNGPPFHDVRFSGEPDWFEYPENFARAWGITRLPLTFEPQVKDPVELNPKFVASSDPELASGYLPDSDSHCLVNLAGIPIMIITAEASYHACYDHNTSAFLTSVGVDHEFIRLESEGIHGNGHMVMIETNSDAISTLIIQRLNAQGF